MGLGSFVNLGSLLVWIGLIVGFKFRIGVFRDLLLTVLFVGWVVVRLVGVALFARCLWISI